MNRSTNLRLGIAALIAAVAFAMATSALKRIPRAEVRVEMQVALPLFVQVLMAGGDRFLAANFSAFRALIVENQKMKPDDFKILGKVQEDVSWLNPAHEDNYYIAAAVLPWSGEVDSAQRILARATRARRFDYQPAFYYGFNLMHFKGDAAGASAWLRESAAFLPEGDNRLQMLNLAAIWLDRSNDLGIAIAVVEAMAKQAQRRDFRRYLEMRVARLRALESLRQAATRFRQRFARNPETLRDLVDSRIIARLPDDPFGIGFSINEQGEVVFGTPAKAGN